MTTYLSRRKKNNMKELQELKELFLCKKKGSRGRALYLLETIEKELYRRGEAEGEAYLAGLNSAKRENAKGAKYYNMLMNLGIDPDAPSQVYPLKKTTT